jgi:hypothetical protein
VTRNKRQWLHEGKYAAEVPVELIEDDTAWSPYLSPQDVHKLDTVRLALRPAATLLKPPNTLACSS